MPPFVRQGYNNGRAERKAAILASAKEKPRLMFFHRTDHTKQPCNTVDIPPAVILKKKNTCAMSQLTLVSSQCVMKGQLSLRSSRLVRFTGVSRAARGKRKQKIKCWTNARALHLTASPPRPPSGFGPGAERRPPPTDTPSPDPPACFPVSDNKLPESSSVFESAHGTRVCL